MKIKYTAVFLIACSLIFAGGCGGSTGEFYSETPHAPNQTADDPFGVSASVSNYYELKSAVLAMIDRHGETSTVPIVDYEGALDQDLRAIALEITTINPLGCFAVSSLTFDQTRVLAYRELNIAVQYKRSSEEIASVRETPGVGDLERQLTDLLTGYATSAFYSVSNVSDTDAVLYQRAIKCWLSSPQTAYGLKGITFVSYPESSAQRIIEVKVQWLYTLDEVRAQAKLVNEKIAQIVAGFKGTTLEDKLNFAADYLAQNVVLDEQAIRLVPSQSEDYPRTEAFTAYGALIGGTAGQAGIAHASKLLCDALGVQSTVVSGTLDGVTHVWLKVQNEEATLNCDLSQSAILMTEDELKAAGYDYSASVYPAAK